MNRQVLSYCRLHFQGNISHHWYKAWTLWKYIVSIIVVIIYSPEEVFAYATNKNTYCSQNIQYFKLQIRIKLDLHNYAETCFVIQRQYALHKQHTKVSVVLSNTCRNGEPYR